MPRSTIELVARPRVVHRHLDTNPRTLLTLDLADVASIRTEARLLGRDDARDPDLERRAPRHLGRRARRRLPDGVRGALSFE